MMERRKNLNDKFGFVDSMKIKDFIDYEQPNGYIVESDRYNSKYSTPVLTAGQSFILGYTNESKGVYEKGPCIIFDDFTTSVHYVDFPFKVKSSAMKILTTKSNADIKYCYYLLLSLSKMPPNHKRQWISTTSEKTHELPSMDKQIAIVQKLDLISDTIAIYTNQIENLDNLVKARFIEMFGDLRTNDKNWQVVSFNECASIDTNMIRDFEGYEDYPHIGIDSIEKDTGRIFGYRTISEDGVISGKYLFTPKHIIYSKIRPILNKVALPDFIGLCSADAYPILVKDTVCTREYFGYTLRSRVFLNYILAFSSRTNLPKVNKSQVEGFKLPLPPIELQNQFADFVQQVDKSRFDIKKSIIELEREVVYD